LRILLLHDNARPHTARAAIDALEMLKFEVLSHPPYSPDLAPSDFHFFPHLKRDLKRTHFTSDDEVKQAVTWIKQLLNSSLTACVNLFYVGKNVLKDKANTSKNKYVNL
jgi:transposase